MWRCGAKGQGLVVDLIILEAFSNSNDSMTPEPVAIDRYTQQNGGTQLSRQGITSHKGDLRSQSHHAPKRTGCSQPLRSHNPCCSLLSRLCRVSAAFIESLYFTGPIYLGDRRHLDFSRIM